MTVTNVLGLIGNTPMVKVQRIDTGPCELFLKLESQNPGGSIKDRIGLSMVEAAERDGHLGPHQRHLVEATAGNTGLGLGPFFCGTVVVHAFGGFTHGGQRSRHA